MNKSNDDSESVACTLSTAEIKDRESWIQKQLIPHLEEVKVDEGEEVEMAFERNDGVIEDIAGWIIKESQCCSFARFELIIPAEEAPVRVHIAATGPGFDILEEGLRGLLDDADFTLKTGPHAR